jgi:hypothetical protein
MIVHFAKAFLTRIDAGERGSIRSTSWRSALSALIRVDPRLKAFSSTGCTHGIYGGKAASFREHRSVKAQAFLTRIAAEGRGSIKSAAHSSALSGLSALIRVDPRLKAFSSTGCRHGIYGGKAASFREHRSVKARAFLTRIAAEGRGSIRSTSWPSALSALIRVDPRPTAPDLRARTMDGQKP